LGLKEKLPLINSDNKGIRITGYIVYAFLALMVIGAILPSSPETTGVSEKSADTDSGSASDSSGAAPSEESSTADNVLSHSGFGNYTFDGQEDVKATVKKGTDPIHMMGTPEIVDSVGYTRDGTQYTVTSTGKKVKGYIDYSGDGYIVVMTQKRSSLTKNEFIDILNTFQRLE